MVKPEKYAHLLLVYHFKVYFRHDLFPPNNEILPSFLSLPNIINLFDIHKPRLCLIDLLPFTKLLELLAIDHNLSERRIIFVPQLLKFSRVLVVL